MPKLPTVTAKQFIKAIKRDGFLFSRSKGSHHYYVHLVKKKQVSVPLHPGRDLGKGLIKSLIKDAGLTEEKFIKLLRKK